MGVHAASRSGMGSAWEGDSVTWGEGELQKKKATAASRFNAPDLHARGSSECIGIQ